MFYHLQQLSCSTKPSISEVRNTLNKGSMSRLPAIGRGSKGRAAELGSSSQTPWRASVPLASQCKFLFMYSQQHPPTCMMCLFTHNAVLTLAMMKENSLSSPHLQRQRTIVPMAEAKICGFEKQHIHPRETKHSEANAKSRYPEGKEQNKGPV